MWKVYLKRYLTPRLSIASSVPQLLGVIAAVSAYRGIKNEGCLA